LGVLAPVEAIPIITRSQVSAVIDADVLRGYKALQNNQFSDARQAYVLVLSRQASHRDALLGLAYAQYGLGDIAQATGLLKRMMELYPRDSEALSALYLISGGDPAQQESLLMQHLSRAEHPAPLLYALGVLYYDQQRYGEAHRVFSRAFSIEPTQPDYAFNLALSLDRLGQAREAARQYVLALNLANERNAVFSRDIARSRVRVLTALPRP
jgi:Flp pilus assembly protein TadD